MLNTSLTPRLSLCLVFSWYNLSLVHVMWTWLAVAAAVFSLVRWEAVFLSWMSCAWTHRKQLDLQFLYVLERKKHFLIGSALAYLELHLGFCLLCRSLILGHWVQDSLSNIETEKPNMANNEDEMMRKAERRWQWRLVLVVCGRTNVNLSFCYQHVFF